MVLADDREEFLGRFGGIAVDRGVATGIDLRRPVRRTRPGSRAPTRAAMGRGNGGVPSSAPSSTSILCAISCTATQKPARGSSQSAITSAHDRISGPAPRLRRSARLPIRAARRRRRRACGSRGRHRDRRSVATSRAGLRSPNSSSGRQHAAASRPRCAFVERRVRRPGVMVFSCRKRAASIAQARVACVIQRGHPRQVRADVAPEVRDRMRVAPRGA